MIVQASPSLAATVRAAAAGGSHIDFGVKAVHDGERAGVRRSAQLRSRVGAHLDGDTTREEMSFFIDGCLHRAKVRRPLADIAASRLLLELEAADGHRIEARAFHFAPEGLLQDRDTVETGTLQRSEQPILG